MSDQASHCPLTRRVSHADLEPPPGQDRQDLLEVPRQRSRGVSLPDKISSVELYRLRSPVSTRTRS